DRLARALPGQPAQQGRQALALELDRVEDRRALGDACAVLVVAAEAHDLDVGGPGPVALPDDELVQARDDQRIEVALVDREALRELAEIDEDLEVAVLVARLHGRLRQPGQRGRPRAILRAERAGERLVARRGRGRAVALRERGHAAAQLGPQRR